MPQRSLPKYACQLNRNLRNHLNVFLSLNRHKTSFFSNRIYHINHSQSLTPFPQYLRKKKDFRQINAVQKCVHKRSVQIQ